MHLLKVNKLILTIIFIVFLFLYALTSEVHKYSFVLFIPFFYLISCFIEAKFYNRHSLVLKIIYILSIFKYFIMPLMIVSTDNIWSYGPKPTEQSFKLAIFITCIEIFTLSLAKYIFFYRRKRNINERENYFRWYTKNINLKFVIFNLFFLLFIMTNLSLILPKDIFAEVNYDDDSIETKNSLSIIAKWIKLIGFPIISLFAYRYINKRFSYYLSVIAFIVFGYFQLGLSRWTLIFYTIISFIFLYKLYGNKVKKLAIPVSVILGFLILSISIYKFSWSVQNSDNKFLDVIIVMSEQFQMYFSGPTLIAQSIDILEYSSLSNKIGIQTFINDYMGSIPVISSFFEQSNRINFIFNEYLFGSNTTNQTQIIPMSGIGYIYFGLFGSTILVFIFTYIALKLETIAVKAKDIINYWLLIYMAIWSGCSIIFCSQIIWGNIIANYLVLFIANNLINSIKIKN